MPNSHENSTKNDVKEVTTAIESEDIQIIDDKVVKYLDLQNKIRGVIRADATDKNALIDDIVDAISKLDASSNWMNILTLGIVPYKNHRKRKKLRKVIENILTKVFDVTLGWYAMDYDDLKETCDYVGGRDYFRREDHRHIYIAVIQKLKEGPLRDKCIELGLITFVNEKLIDIRDHYLEFKTKEL